MQDFVKGLAISQLIPKKKFNELVKKWQVDKGVTKLKTEKLLEILIFGQIFEKKTLRDMEDSYGIPKSTLDDALSKRSYGFFQELCSIMSKELIAFVDNRKDRQDLRELIAVDSSICNVHGSMASQFLVTKMRGQAGIKFHAAFNVTHQWIEDFQVTGCRKTDGTTAKNFKYKKNKTYIFDRAYMDLSLMMKLGNADAKFVMRLKNHGQRLKRIHDCHVDSSQTGILYDGKWTPSEAVCYNYGIKPRSIFYRHVIYRDPVSMKLFDFVTSDSELPAIEIANIYRKRWAVELLFRWLKGHLNIRRFSFKNLNATKIQLAIAVLVQLQTRMRMLTEKFKGTCWDYLRLQRNILDRVFYKILSRSRMDCCVGHLLQETSTLQRMLNF